MNSLTVEQCLTECAYDRETALRKQPTLMLAPPGVTPKELFEVMQGRLLGYEAAPLTVGAYLRDRAKRNACGGPPSRHCNCPECYAYFRGDEEMLVNLVNGLQAEYVATPEHDEAPNTTPPGLMVIAPLGYREWGV